MDAFHALSSRDRRAIQVGVALLVPALFWVSAVRPYRATLETLQDRLVSERSLLERERAALQEAPTLPLRLESARLALSRWETRFVRSPNPAIAEAEVTSRLEDAARESRVLLNEVRTVAIPRGESSPWGLVPIRLSVRGESDFEGILRFLDGMEQDPLLFRIVGLSMDPVPTGGGGRGGGAAVQRGAMSFVVIVEAFVPAQDGEAP
jgi:hypothetical protein